MTQIIGHDRQAEVFQASMRSGKLHHGWLFAGQKGIGKASFAKQAAAWLVDPNNKQANLIEQRSHPDVIWIERLPKEPPKEGEIADAQAEKKRNITIDQIRSLQQRLTTRPSLGEKRVVIIDAADDLERAGANALLKSLEEPPIGTYFFLVTHASDRLLPTIRSRCRMLRFNPLMPDELHHVLHHHHHQTIDESDIMALYQVSNGAPGEALRILDLNMPDLEEKMNRLIGFGDADNQIRHQLAESLSAKTAQNRYEAFLRRVPSRIAEHARLLQPMSAAASIDAYHAADSLAARAVALSLDKSAVIFEMGSLLASLQTHKQRG
jgi:DNA polymerase-3 subunit delta'